jgi:hypothetical protein
VHFEARGGGGGGGRAERLHLAAQGLGVGLRGAAWRAG